MVTGLMQFLKPLDRKLIRDLGRMWGQGLAIALVVGAGVAMYVMTEGMLRSLVDTRDAYYARYAFADIFAPVKRAPNHVIATISAIPGVRVAEGRITKYATLDMPKLDEPAQERLLSFPGNGKAGLNRLHLVKGRWLRPGTHDEVMASEAFTAAHGLVPGDSVTALINGRKRNFRIAGTVQSPEFIYALAPGAMFPDDQRFAVMWMPRTTLAAAFNMEGAFNEVLVRLEPGANADEVIKRLDDALENYGAMGAYKRERQISDWYLQGEMNQLTNMSRFAPPIFLGVAVFLLNMAVGRWIKMERGEIGLLKAFGYSTRAVAFHYIKFVLAITFVGIVLGFFAGTWLGWGMALLYKAFFHFPFLFFSIDAAVYFVAAMVSIAAALLGTIAAVSVAANLSPAEAMTPAPPTTYRRTHVERWFKNLQGPTRMIVRHILRWPVRAGFTCIGIAFGAAMMIGTMFFTDATDHMMRIQFTVIDRQDATVTFNDVKSSKAVDAVRSLPGVLRAEPFRMVPVTLSFGSAKQRVALKGLPKGATLNRALNASLMPVNLPETGISISSKLSELLGAGLGDRIVVKVSEGHRKTVLLPVTQIVDTYIAMPAYMDLAVLNRMMEEGPLVSGAFVLLDDDLEAAFYSKLKNTPAVSQVAVKETMYKAFRDTLEENIDIMNFFNTAFAIVIAIGVVYNAGQISLSERSRELASLRVLGFTRGEAAYILLGELALLTLVALPLGCLLGYGLAWAWTLALDTDLYRIPLVLSAPTFANAILVVLAAAVATGLVAYRQIINLDLVAALKIRE